MWVAGFCLVTHASDADRRLDEDAVLAIAAALAGRIVGRVGRVASRIARRPAPQTKLPEGATLFGSAGVRGPPMVASQLARPTNHVQVRCVDSAGRLSGAFLLPATRRCQHPADDFRSHRQIKYISSASPTATNRDERR